MNGTLSFWDTVWCSNRFEVEFLRISGANFIFSTTLSTAGYLSVVMLKSSVLLDVISRWRKLNYSIGTIIRSNLE